jgi:Xaa-Pro aminopeptidase
MAGRSIELFNGVNLEGWRQAGPGGFRIENRMLVTEGGLGLLWYSARQFKNFELTVDLER